MILIDESSQRQVSLPVPDLKNELRLVIVTNTKEMDSSLRVTGIGVDVTLNPSEVARFKIEIDLDRYAAIQPDYQTERERPLKWVRL